MKPSPWRGVELWSMDLEQRKIWAIRCVEAAKARLVKQLEKRVVLAGG